MEKLDGCVKAEAAGAGRWPGGAQARADSDWPWLTGVGCRALSLMPHPSLEGLRHLPHQVLWRHVSEGCAFQGRLSEGAPGHCVSARLRRWPPFIFVQCSLHSQ